MAYKFSVGPQVIGDLKAKDDAQRDTLIDFGEDQIEFQTSGSVRLQISNDHLSSSLPLSASSINIQEGINVAGQNVLDNEGNLSVGSITLVDQDGPLYQMPSGDGNADEVMATDGTGQVQFRPVSELGAASFLHYGYNPNFTNSSTEVTTVNGTTNDYGYVMPLSGVVTHITAQFEHNCQTTDNYTFTATLRKNNLDVASGTVSFDATAGQNNRDQSLVYALPTPVSFIPYDRLTVFMNFDKAGITGHDVAVLVRIVTTIE